MAETSPDWRRYEPLVRDEGANQALLENANAVLLRTTREELKTLREAFNLILRENDRLQSECDRLREAVSEEGVERPRSVPGQDAGTSGEVDRPSGQTDADLLALSEGARKLESKLSGLTAPARAPEERSTQSVCVERNETPLTLRSPSEQEAVLERVSKLVAQWVFLQPSPGQTRLVRDALKGRWLPEGAAPQRIDA